MASKHDIARLFFAAALAVASVAHAGEAWADAQGRTGTSATATVGFRITRSGKCCAWPARCSTFMPRRRPPAGPSPSSTIAR